MWVFLGRRLLVAVAAVITVSFVAFVAFGLSFDPTGQMRLSPDPRPRQFLLHYYHLSDPILERYWLWAKSIFTDGFGRTISLDVSGSPPHLNSLGNPIGPAIWHSAGVTAQLVGFALVITALGSIVLGTLSAARRRTWVDV